MSDLSFRAATRDDWPRIFQLMRLVFHIADADEEYERVEREVFEPDRSLVATDGGELVGHVGAYTRELSVPGGPVPAAHVSLVGVAPTHRRRGLLTQLMHRQLSGTAEPLAVLWASEGPIYPRFGYGAASELVSFTVERHRVRLPVGGQDGRLRTAAPGEARGDLARVYEAARPKRPGWSSRDEHWWELVLSDPPARRHGATELRATLHEAGGGVDGYAVWRTRHTGPELRLEVQEVVTTDPAAYLALWRFLLGVDLSTSVVLSLGGPGEPLRHLVDAPERLGTTLGKGLYVRIVDLPAALAARRYAAPVDVVLEVTDPVLPANSGRWRLTGGPDRADCVPAPDTPADLACAVTDLGAAYLGGTRLADLAAAGRVTELRPGTLPAVSTGFGWHTPPAGIEVF